MTANLLIKALDEPKTYTVNAGDVNGSGHVDRATFQLSTPHPADGEKMRIAASVKPTAALSGDTLRLFARYEDSLGHANWVNYYTSSTLAANSWTRVSGDLPVPSGMTVKGIGIGVYKACTFDVMDFELWDGTDATKAVASHTPYATEGHLEAVYATQASLKVQSDRITSEVSARAQTDKAVSDLSTRVTQTETGITTEISDRKTAVSNAQTDAVNSANANTTNALKSYTKTADLAATDAVKAAKKAGTDAQANLNSYKTANDQVVASHTTSISQLSDSITSAVSGSTTYTAPDGTTKTNALATKVNQTAKDVTTAIDTANGTAMLIRSDSTGVTVGKSTDGGKTFPSGRTHIDSDSFDVLDNDGNVVATLSKNTLSLLAGMFKIKTEVQTPDGGTAEYYDTIISDGDVTFGDGYIDRSYIGFESRLADDWKKRDSIVNIQSASGDGIGGSSLSVSPSGIGLFGEVKVEGKSGASGLKVGGNGTTIAGLFFGSKVVSADAGEARLWTPSEFESAFGRQFDKTRDYVGVMNADAGVNGRYGVSVATYWSSGNIWVGGSGVVPGLIRVNYLVILG